MEHSGGHNPAGGHVRNSRSEAVGFAQRGDLSRWAAVERAAETASLRGPVKLIDRGSSGHWLHANSDLERFAEAIARLLNAPARLYQVELEENTIRCSAYAIAPDGQKIPLQGIPDESDAEDSVSPLALTDEALDVLLEMYEPTHAEDLWVEVRVI